MAIILDADVIIRGERGTFDLAAWAASRPNDLFEVAAITVAELWYGVDRAVEPHKSKRRKYLEENIGAANFDLDAREMKLLDEALAPGKVSGKRYAESMMATIDR